MQNFKTFAICIQNSGQIIKNVNEIAASGWLIEERQKWVQNEYSQMKLLLLYEKKFLI